MTSTASSVRDVDFTAPGAVDPSDFGLDGLTSASARLAVDLSPTSGLGASRLSQVRRLEGGTVSPAGRAWFHLSTSSGPGVVMMDQQLAVVLADLLMGGGGVVEQRSLTSVEERVLVPHLQRAMGPLSNAFMASGIGEVEVREPGRGAVGLRGDMFAVEISVAATTDLDSPDIGTITLIVPATPPQRTSRAAESRDGSLGAFLGVQLQLGVRTDPTIVAAEKLQALAVGEVLSLRHRCDVPLRVCVGPVLVASGLLGRHEDNMTVQVLALAGGDLAREMAAHSLRFERPVSGVLRLPLATATVDISMSTEDQPDRADNQEGDQQMSMNMEESAVSAADSADNAHGATGSAALGLLADVPVEVSVEIGRTMVSLRDAIALGPGQVVTLDAAADALATVLVNGRVVARGQVVVVDDVYGVRISELVEE